MYSEIKHIFFSSMSNPSELFLVKDDKEDLSSFEIVKTRSPTLMFQNESIERPSSSSKKSHCQGKYEENKDEEKEGEENHQSRLVVSKHFSDSSEAVTTPSSSAEQLKVVENDHEEETEEEEEEEEDGFRTPTSLDHRIPVTKQCPPAPRKIQPSLKRKASYSSSPCNCRHPLDLSKEVELLFPTQQHVPLSDSHQSTKKVRREEPK